MRRQAMMLGVGGAVLLAAAGAAAGVWLQRDGYAPALSADGRALGADGRAAETDLDDAADDAVRQAQPLYYTFDAPFTVNTRDSAAMVQATVAISTRYAQTVDDAKGDAPALRSAIIAVLSDTTEAAASTDAGKRQLEAGILAAVNRQLKADGYTPAIDSAYFSDFIIQGNDDG